MSLFKLSSGDLSAGISTSIPHHFHLSHLSYPLPFLFSAALISSRPLRPSSPLSPLSYSLGVSGRSRPETVDFLISRARVVPWCARTDALGLYPMSVNLSLLVCQGPSCPQRLCRAKCNVCSAGIHEGITSVRVSGLIVSSV